MQRPKRGSNPLPTFGKWTNGANEAIAPAHVTAAKAQTQGSSMKDPRVEEPKPGPRESKATNPQPPESAETSEKARMEKKNWQKEKRDKKDSTTPATGANASNVSGPKE